QGCSGQAMNLASPWLSAVAPSQSELGETIRARRTPEPSIYLSWSGRIGFIVRSWPAPRAQAGLADRSPSAATPWRSEHAAPVRAAVPEPFLCSISILPAGVGP